jgi:hypothetical protein
MVVRMYEVLSQEMGRENVRRRRAERDSARGGKLGHAIKIALPAKEAAFRGGYPSSRTVIFRKTNNSKWPLRLDAFRR